MRASRARTLAHLQRMATLGTAVTATFACGKTSGTEESHGCGKNPLASQPDANATMTSSGSSGYAVVDPVPTPAFCPGVAAATKATAKLEKAAGGTRVVTVTLDAPVTVPGFKFVNDAPANAYAATVASQQITDTKAVTKLSFPAETTNVAFSVKTMCNQGPGTLHAAVTIEKGPKGETAVVVLNEY